MNIEKYLDVARISKTRTEKESTLFSKQQLPYVEKCLQKIVSKKNISIAFYGTGMHTKKMFDYFQENGFDINRIKCIISPEIAGEKMFGKEILDLNSAIEKFDLQAIIISSYKYENEIYDRICGLIPSEIELVKIYNAVIDDAEERLNLFDTIQESNIGSYGEVYYQHINRYFWALGYAKDKSVIDIACGTGYGSDILATKAKEVIGVDVDEQTIIDAKLKFHSNNLSFVHSSIQEFTVDKKVDLIVSFETIEHIENGEELFNFAKNSLCKDGVFIVSTPVAEYSGISRINKYHINQYTNSDFVSLVNKYFDDVIFYRQDPGFNGAISIDDGNMVDCIFDETYMIAVCYNS